MNLVPDLRHSLNNHGFITAIIYLLKVNNRNKRKSIHSKLLIKTPQRGHWRRSEVFIANFEHISQLLLVFLSFTLNRSMFDGIIWRKVNYNHMSPFVHFTEVLFDMILTFGLFSLKLMSKNITQTPHKLKFQLHMCL